MSVALVYRRSKSWAYPAFPHCLMLVGAPSGLSYWVAAKFVVNCCWEKGSEQVWYLFQVQGICPVLWQPDSSQGIFVIGPEGMMYLPVCIMS
jgi:hypothetical protein